MKKPQSLKANELRELLLLDSMKDQLLLESHKNPVTDNNFLYETAQILIEKLVSHPKYKEYIEFLSEKS